MSEATTATQKCAYPPCGVEFTPRRKWAKYHTDSCRVRHKRAEKYTRKIPTGRAPNGEFARKDGLFYGTYVDDKGYLRICAGPLRNVRVATLVAWAIEGRKLEKDEDVHHRNGDKLNPCPLCGNLEVRGHAEHGWVSAMQHQFMRRKEEMDRKEWEAEYGSLENFHAIAPPRMKSPHFETT
jgi:hypothetical protein